MSAVSMSGAGIRDAHAARMDISPHIGRCRRLAVLSVLLSAVLHGQTARCEQFPPPLSLDGASESETDDDLRRRLDEQQAELDQLRSRLDVAALSLPETPAGPSFGYDNGFFISGPGDVDIPSGEPPFLMVVNSRLQLRHTVFDSDGLTPDENDFEFERLRLLLRGHAYTPDLTYFIQIDGDSDQGEFADWLDYYVRYDVGHHAWDLGAGRFGIRFGKWKLPFNRARAESGFKLQFADRAMASAFFDINRSIGASLWGRLDVHDTPVLWEAAVFNGFNTQGFIPVRSGDLDRNLAASARFTTDLLGEWGNDGEPDLTPHQQPAVRVGGGFAFSRVDREGLREFNRFRAVDSGATLDALLPADVSAYNVFLYAADANFKWRGWSVLSEFYFRRLNQFAGGGVPDLFDHGLLLQSGFFICPEKLELIARWSRIAGDSGTLGARERSADEVAGGIVWYIKGHFVKLTLDVTRVNGVPFRDRALNLLPGDDGLLYRTQFQLWF